MKVLRPSRNRQTQGYSSGHKGYDHSGRGDDLNYYASLYGKVVQSKNSETKNWINKGTLTTKDYGNYLKIKGLVDGKSTYQLGAHLEVGSVLSTGTEVKAGQVIARIGNTGNSTGRHCHTEYRDSNNKNFEVSFVDTLEVKEETKMYTKTQEEIIREAYLAVTGEWPTDDEIKARLQKNENPIELIEDLLKGDSRSKPRWLKIWEETESNTELKESLENYKNSFHRLKELLKLPVGSGSEEVIGKVAGILESLSELEDAQIPKVVYKHSGKDFEKIAQLLNLILILEK